MRRPSSAKRKPSVEPTPGTVQSVSRACQILDLLIRNPAGLAVSAVGSALSLNRATVHRLLRTLVAEGLVVQDSPSRHYRFNPAVWLQTAPHLHKVRAVIEEIQRVLDELARTTGATAILAMVEADGRNLSAALFAVPPVMARVEFVANQRAPAHAIAAGKCYLAALSSSELEQWLSGSLPKLTPRTITSPARLRRELQLIRRNGYAVSLGEYQRGVASVAVPIGDAEGRVVGGLALAAPGETLPGHVQRDWVPRLLRAASRVTTLLAAGLWAVPKV